MRSRGRGPKADGLRVLGLRCPGQAARPVVQPSKASEWLRSQSLRVSFMRARFASSPVSGEGAAFFVDMHLRALAPPPAPMPHSSTNSISVPASAILSPVFSGTGVALTLALLSSGMSPPSTCANT